MRAPFDPYGAASPAIDQQLGDAFQVVRFVARHIPEIASVAYHMEGLYKLVSAGGKANADLVGLPAEAVDMGAFSGDIIPDSATIKAALQVLSDFIEELSANTQENFNNQGSFTGTTIPDNATLHDALQALETALEQVYTIAPVISTQAEAEAGENNTKVMTPLRVSQAIESRYPFILDRENQTGTQGQDTIEGLLEFIEGTNTSLAAFLLATGSTLVNHRLNVVGGVMRSIRDRLSDRVSVKDFGAIGNGLSHPIGGVTSLNGQNTSGWTLTQWKTIFPRATALTQELDFLAHDAALQLGRIVYAPKGTYLFGQDTLTISVDGASLLGDARAVGSTKWVTAHPTADIIVLDTVSGSFVDNGTITTLVNKTAGAAIKMIRSHNVSSRGMRFDSGAGGKRLFSCYDFEAGGDQFLYHVEDFEINTGSYGFRAGALGGGLVQDIWIGKGCASGLTVAGIYLVNASGIYIYNMPDFIGCKYGLYTRPASNQMVSGLICTGLLTDTGTGHGVLLAADAGGLVVDHQYSCLWTSSNGNNIAGNETSDQYAGIYIDAGDGAVDGIQFDCLRSVANVSSGVTIIKGSNITISNPQIGHNSSKSSAAGHGIYVGAGENVSIVGGRIGSFGRLKNYGAANNQGYAIFIDGTASHTIVSGVNTLGNVSGGVMNAGSNSWINQPSW